MIRTVLAVAVAAHVVLLGLMMAGGTDPTGPRPSVQRGVDFLHCWGGGVILADEDRGPAQLYDKRVFREAQRAVFDGRHPYPVAYPPPLYQACAVLVPLGFGDAARVWTAVMPMAWGVGLALILGCVPGLSGSTRTTALLLGLASPSLWMNTASGQAGGVWMLLLGVGLLLWRRGRPIAAGLVLGLLCAKPGLAAPILLTLVLTRQGRMVGGFVGGGAVLVAASVGIDGLGVWLDWIELLRGGALGKMMVIPHRHHTLAALLSYPVRRTELGPLMKALGPLVGIALTGWAAWRAGRIEAEDPDALFRLGAVLSMALLASPHLVGYDTGVYAPAFVGTALLLWRGAARRPRLGGVLLGLAFIAPVTFPISWELHVSLAALFVLLWAIWAVTELPHPLDRRAGSEP